MVDGLEPKLFVSQASSAPPENISTKNSQLLGVWYQMVTETRPKRDTCVFTTHPAERGPVKSEEENSLFSSNQREPTRSAPEFCPALIL